MRATGKKSGKAPPLSPAPLGGETGRLPQSCGRFHWPFLGQKGAIGNASLGTFPHRVRGSESFAQNPTKAELREAEPQNNTGAAGPWILVTARILFPLKLCFAYASAQ